MLFKSLRYGDIDTKEYDVYISGDAVFNSPARDVEMIEIPGRNGAYALDKRRCNIPGRTGNQKRS